MPSPSAACSCTATRATAPSLSWQCSSRHRSFVAKGLLSSATSPHILSFSPSSRPLASTKEPHAGFDSSTSTSVPAAHSAASQPAVTAATWRVYLGKMPLVGFEPIADALKGTPAHELLQMHTYVLLEGPDQVWSFDFLPLNPTSPLTAAALVTAQAAPGELRTRRLGITTVRSSSSITYLGESQHADPLPVVNDYNRAYNTQLHLVHNNCQQYTDGLIDLLKIRAMT